MDGLATAQGLPQDLAAIAALFGDTPQATLEAGREAVQRGVPRDQVRLGRHGEGPVGRDAEHRCCCPRSPWSGSDICSVDAGQIWVEDVEAAAARLPGTRSVPVRPGSRSRFKRAPTRLMARWPSAPAA